ncbi:DEAD/DEAH box helicase [Sphingobacterium puteale]|uniref:DEAD/DEAH box helicase n=1 Tax=Sphingobacterium puteale TaxID=2420510 RepID=A0A420VVE0_9SPHI|nr:DEAD/DEAH box helicase [Sphingobacterium puteale]RKO70311.1 DEAD/DEAH box helicase [Sphingobacterium puteale]
MKNEIDVTIPWQNKQEKSLSIVYLKGFFNEKPARLTSNFKIILEESVFNNKYAFESLCKENIRVLITLTADHLKANCSCGRMNTKLCEHVYGLLREKLSGNKHYFFHLYDPKWFLVHPDQRELFGLSLKDEHKRIPKVKINATADCGSIYGFHNPSELCHVASNRVYASEPSISKSEGKFIVAIPINNTIDQLPFLLPFLSGERKKNVFKESYLLKDDMPHPEYLTSHEMMLDAVAKKMMQLGASAFNVIRPNELSVVERNERDHRIMDLWRDLISNQLSQNEVIFFYSHTNNFGLRHYQFRYSSAYNQSHKLKIANGDFKLKIQVVENQKGLLMKVLGYYKGNLIKKIKFLSDVHSFFVELSSKYVLFIDDIQVGKLLNQFRHSAFKIFVLRQDIAKFYEEILHLIAQHFPIVYKNETLQDHAATKKRIEETKVLEVSLQDDALLLKASIDFGTVSLPIVEMPSSTVLTYVDNEIQVQVRDVNDELAFSDFVKNQHESFAEQTSPHTWELRTSLIARTNWLKNLRKTCQDHQIKLKLIGLVKGSYYYPFSLKWDVVELKSQSNLLYINIKFKLGKLLLEPSLFENYLFEKKNWFKIDTEDYIYISDSLKSLFLPLFGQARIEDPYIILTSAQLISFQTQLEKIDPRIINDSTRERRDKLANMTEIPLLDVPDTVKATLRPYQRIGFSWMGFLQEFQWGGILADDMGLGKTLQVITLLEYYYQNNPDANPSLIIVPNSLLFNWQNEIEKFVPERNYYIYHGIKRKGQETLAKASFVLTTYGTAMADLSFLQSKSFSYMILDESQMIKNRNSKRFESLFTIIASFRIAMTGTPIENGIQDIYAQMTMVNPGFFGNYRNFNKMFKSMGDGEEVDTPLTNLQKMIAPFILRRTKKQVAIDLPDKTETILYLDMQDGQRRIYDNYRKKYRDEIEENLNREESAKSKFLAIEALQKLRQLCNSPVLMKEGNFVNESVKMDFIDEMMEEVAPNHKILLFSSYTSMLKLVAQRIEKHDIGYTYLDGRMNQEQRQAAVKRFQNDDMCRVFLISLKAGGTGLNLTAADYVYILDPWWNPAAEAQAIDRCYRIGQDKHVMAYKIVCRDSVEERILELQDSKKRMAEGVILDEANLMKSISKEELLKLFE